MVYIKCCIKQHPFTCTTREKQVLLKLEWNRDFDWLGECHWHKARHRRTWLMLVTYSLKKPNVF